MTTVPESTAATSLDAGADQAFSGRSTGTAWRCMLAPISARFASSCSRNGTSEAATETICCRRDVHVLDALNRGQHRFAAFARGHQFIGQRAVPPARRWPGR